jgi:hypothetical protein
MMSLERDDFTGDAETRRSEEERVDGKKAIRPPISTPSHLLVSASPVKLSLFIGALFALMAPAGVGEEIKRDEHYPFRVDWANQDQPWYVPKPLEFPPHHSDHRVGGELIAADFYHRSGTFRTNTGELVDFTMPPYGTVYHRNAEAELRDVPLGTFLLFFLHQDASGAFTRVATMQDEFTMLVGHGLVYRLDQARADRLTVTKLKKSDAAKPEVGTNELLVDAATRVWRGKDRITLAELKPGDELAVQLGGCVAIKGPRRTTDIWVGAETHQALTAQQFETHRTFLKQRGVPAWIEKVEGRQLTVAMFASDRANLLALFKAEGIAPEQWAKENRYMDVVVADPNLRTYNPPVDRQHSRLVSTTVAPSGVYGFSGERWVLEPKLLLEGHRPGRIVRLFIHGGWKVEDMPFGEGIYEHGFEPDDDIGELYPYRTDLLNPQLPWFQARPGAFPPENSAHRVGGELLAVDAARRSGRFRTDLTGATVDFTLPPYGTVLRLGAEGSLADLPLGTHCWFHLHQDAKGAFTNAAVVEDDVSGAIDSRVTWRVEEVDAAAGRLRVARQIPQIKNYQDEMITPPDVGRIELCFDGKSRLWKGEQQVKIGELAVGDVLLANRSGITGTSQGVYTEAWIGADTLKAASEKQRQANRERVRAAGMPGLVASVDGKRVTVNLIAGVRQDFGPILDGDPWGKPVHVFACDEQLNRQGEADHAGFNNHLPEADTAGSYGCSGIRWVFETQKPEAYRAGQAIRVFKDGWALPAAAK